MVESIISFGLGFVVGATSGALYTTNLYGYEPKDLVEAQKKRNEEWKEAIKQKFAPKAAQVTQEQQVAQPVQQVEQVQQAVVVEPVANS